MLLRLDAGEVMNGYKNICLQVNSEAKNTALKDYENKHGTHCDLTVASIKVDAPEDQQATNIVKALDAMEAQCKSKIG